MSQHAVLAELLRKAPRKCWLALSGDESRIVTHGLTPQEAEEKARANGEEDPVLMWVPETWAVRVF